MCTKQLLPVLCIKLPFLMVDIKDIRLLLLDMYPLQPMLIKLLCPAASHLLPPLAIKLLLQVVLQHLLQQDTKHLPRDMLLQLQITSTNHPLWDILIQPAAPILLLQPTFNQGLHIKHHHPPPLPATLLLAIPPSHHPTLPIQHPSQQDTLTTKLPILTVELPLASPLFRAISTQVWGARDNSKGE